MYYLHGEKKMEYIFKNNFYNSFAHREAVILDVIACVITEENVNTK